MQSLLRIKKVIKKPFEIRPRTIEPEKAYDIWAPDYDNQPNNLILTMEQELFSGLLQNLPLQKKIIIDVGCGTGRHWQELFAKDPRLIIGFDVSEGMLAILKNKYPDAIIYKHTDNQLSMLCNRYCDLIISTLTLAHIDNIAEVFKEWDRVLKPGGSLIITDYHCEALLKGASRTFRNKNKLIAIKSHIYPIKQIMQIADSSGISQIQFCERKIDELVKHYYTKQNADHLYQHFYGTPIIYGIHFKKGYAFS